MLTSWTKRDSLLAVVAVTLLMTLASGTAVVQAQDGVTLTPGPEASPQDALLAEALGAVVQAGFDPADFDIEKAVFDPLGRAVFLPVRATDEVRRQAQAFVQDEQRFLLAGLLYTRQSFEFQGKRYGRGLHPVVLENRSAAASTTKNPAEGPTLFDHGGIHITVEAGCEIGTSGAGCSIGIGVDIPLPTPDPTPGDLISQIVNGIVQFIQNALETAVCEPLAKTPAGGCD